MSSVQLLRFEFPILFQALLCSIFSFSFSDFHPPVYSVILHFRTLEHIARAGRESSFIEFDYCKSGSAYIYIPPSSIRTSGANQVRFAAFFVVSILIDAKFLLPQWHPNNGYTFMCWAFIQSYGADELGQPKRCR